MRAEIENFEPRIAEVAKSAAKNMPSQPRGIHFIPEEIFALSPSISIDYAVMERTTRAACKPVHYRWSDMGTWNSVWSHFNKDGFGNANRGPVSLLETKNSLVISDSLHTAVVGLENVAVVVTRDAVLVAPRDVSASLSHLVAALKSDPGKEHLAVTPATASHIWGHESCVAHEETFSTKLVTLWPGKSTPLMTQQHSDIHVLTISGQALAKIGGAEIQVAASTPLFVPAGTPFRIVNSSAKEVRYLELSISREIDAQST
jgi:mannose-6-phosphate isomerase-like protein (cupin superfamily)